MPDILPGLKSEKDATYTRQKKATKLCFGAHKDQTDKSSLP